MFKKATVVPVKITCMGTPGEIMVYTVESEKAEKLLLEWYPKNVKFSKQDNVLMDKLSLHQLREGYAVGLAGNLARSDA